MVWTGWARAAALGAAALALGSCGGATSFGGGLGRAEAQGVSEFRTVPNGAYDAWVAAFLPRAAAAGIDGGTLQAAFAGAGYIPAVVERDRNQAEFSRTLQDYLLSAVNDGRVEEGRAAMARHADALARIEATYGVDASVVAAVWGLESSYGRRRGEVPVISALSTLAFDGRRGAFFESQLLAALRILERGDTTPERMVGSWAGAMGHTQFIPTSYQAFAVDFTGDGRRDIWSDDPSDSLASTAAYLAQSGWRRGEPWGELATGGAGGRVISPAGEGGPAFRVYGNFDVIKRYNNADSYAIAVGHLADRLRGGPPLPGLFSQERALTLAERVELQERLTAMGYDTGGTDGSIGPRTIAAIRAFQGARGLDPTGFAAPSTLAALR